jgi:hypothetical protein
MCPKALLRQMGQLLSLCLPSHLSHQKHKVGEEIHVRMGACPSPQARLRSSSLYSHNKATAGRQTERQRPSSSYSHSMARTGAQVRRTGLPRCALGARERAAVSRAVKFIVLAMARTPPQARAASSRLDIAFKARRLPTPASRPFQRHSPRAARPHPASRRAEPCWLPANFHS